LWFHLAGERGRRVRPLLGDREPGLQDPRRWRSGGVRSHERPEGPGGDERPQDLTSDRTQPGRLGSMTDPSRFCFRLFWHEPCVCLFERRPFPRKEVVTMNAPQVHLMLNHLPVMGVLFSALVLAIGRVLRNEAISRLAIAVLAASALAAVPVLLSGEPAEKSIEHTAGVSERVIEAHEDAARVAIVALEILGAVGLVGWFRHRRSTMSRRFTTLLLAGVLR